MTTSTAWSGGELDELAPAECWRLLGSQAVGRVAYADPGGPVVLPLNYVVRDHTVWFRTASWSQLAVHLPDQPVGFQVDHVDEVTRTGWSVLVRGRARHVLGPTAGSTSTPPPTPQPTPWPEGPRTMTFRIEVATVVGRVLQPV